MNPLSLVIQILGVPGIFFHVSVLIVLVRGIRRKDESFRHAFFMLYIASSVADCAFIVVVSLGRREQICQKVLKAVYEGLSITFFIRKRSFLRKLPTFYVISDSIRGLQAYDINRNVLLCRQQPGKSVMSTDPDSRFRSQKLPAH